MYNEHLNFGFSIIHGRGEVEPDVKRGACICLVWVLRCRLNSCSIGQGWTCGERSGWALVTCELWGMTIPSANCRMSSDVCGYRWRLYLRSGVLVLVWSVLVDQPITGRARIWAALQWSRDRCRKLDHITGSLELTQNIKLTNKKEPYVKVLKNIQY